MPSKRRRTRRRRQKGGRRVPLTRRNKANYLIADDRRRPTLVFRKVDPEEDGASSYALMTTEEAERMAQENELP